MKLKPCITEKTLKEAEAGNYTFLVDPSLAKKDIAELVSNIYKVTVVSTKTINYRSRTKKMMRGNIRTIKAYKKAVVTLSAKDKIDVFEVDKKKK